MVHGKGQGVGLILGIAAVYEQLLVLVTGQEMVYLDGAFYGPDTEERAWCYTCQHFWDDHCELAGHAFNNKTVNLTEPYWHNVEYRTVHHDAVYETQCEPDFYETVHHDAVYETQKVWVED